MLKVLVVVDKARAGTGPHRHVVATLNALTSRREVKVHLLTNEVDYEEPFASRLDKITMGFKPHSAHSILTNLWFVYLCVKQSDIIYVPCGLKTFLYVWLFRGKKKFIAGPNVTGLTLNSPPAFQMNRMCDKWIDASDTIFRLSLLGGGNPEHVVRIHHGIDTAAFSPANYDSTIWKSSGLRGEKATILYVGHIEKLRKGAQILLRAFKLLKQHRDDIQLVLIGSGGDKLIEKKPKDTDGIYWLGPKFGSDLRRFMASATVGCVPSSWEPFGFTVLEFMASGTPVVASGVGGIAEQLEHGISGWLVDLVYKETSEFSPKAPEILANALEKVIDDYDLRKKLGQNARKRAEIYFSESRLGDELLDLFFKTLHKKQS